MTVFIVFVAFVINDLLGFTYYYCMDKKISHVERLNTMIKDSSTDSLGRRYAWEMREQVVGRRPYYLLFFSFLSESMASKSMKQAMNPPKIDTTTNMAATVSIRNDLLFILSSSGLYFILGLIGLPVMIADKKSDLTMPRKVVAGIAMLILFSFIGWFYFWLTDLIPAVWGKWWINYILNIILQFAPFIALGIIDLRKKRRRRQRGGTQSRFDFEN